MITNNDLDRTVELLYRYIPQAEERISLGERNKGRVEQADKDIRSTENTIQMLKQSTNRCTELYKAISKYAEDRKELSLKMLKDAISQAGDIVPDADVSGIKLVTVDNKAKIVSTDDQDVNLREGSAYRTVLGMLIRYTLMRVQPSKLQCIFLDEAFNTLSETTQSAMREYIDIFKDDMLIVGIEQHNTLYQGIPHKEFRAVKGVDKVTKILYEGEFE